MYSIFIIIIFDQIYSIFIFVLSKSTTYVYFSKKKNNLCILYLYITNLTSHSHYSKITKSQQNKIFIRFNNKHNKGYEE